MSCSVRLVAVLIAFALTGGTLHAEYIDAWPTSSLRDFHFDIETTSVGQEEFTVDSVDSWESIPSNCTYLYVADFCNGMWSATAPVGLRTVVIAESAGEVPEATVKFFSDSGQVEYLWSGLLGINKSMQKVLQHLTGLKYLCITVTDEHQADWTRVAQWCTRVEVLDIWSGGVNGLELKGLELFGTLRTLSLRGTAVLTPGSVERLASAKALRAFFVEGIRIEDERVFTELAKLSQLTCLSLAGFDGSEDVLGVLLSKMANLEGLVLFGGTIALSSLVGDHMLAHVELRRTVIVEDKLFETIPSNLVSLKCSECSMTATCLSVLVSSTSMRSLCLETVTFKPGDLQRLLTSINSTLKVLELTDVKAPPLSAETGILRFKDLQWLRLHACDWVTTEQVEGISMSKSLKGVDLSNNPHLRRADFQLLAECETLTYVDVNGNRSVDDEVVVALGGTLKLKHLLVSGCTDVSAKGLRYILAKCPLQFIDVRGCTLISDELLDQLKGEYDRVVFSN